MRFLMMSLMAFCMVGLYAQEEESEVTGNDSTEVTSEVAAADDVSAETSDAEEASN